MKNEEAAKMLTAKVECMERENSGTNLDCNHRNCDECDLCYTQGTMGEQIEALRMAIEVLEKQIPKKPIHINKNKVFDGNWKKICPSCGSMLIERITTPERSFPRHYNYTQHCWCGQAIDWTEGEG